jgi:hypothetical protein
MTRARRLISVLLAITVFAAALGTTGREIIPSASAGVLNITTH